MKIPDILTFFVLLIMLLFSLIGVNYFIEHVEKRMRKGKKLSKVDKILRFLLILLPFLVIAIFICWII